MVADIEQGTHLPGYEGWEPGIVLADGSTLASGVLISTQAYGPTHYPAADPDLIFIRHA